MCFLQIYDLLEDKDPNKSKPSVDLKVNPEAKDHSTVLCKKVDLFEAKRQLCMAKSQIKDLFELLLLTNL